MKKLVILGGGYGGFAVVQELLHSGLPNDVEMILVDRMPFQGLKTEYYALAAGTVSELDIRVQFPVDPRLTLKYGEVERVSLEEKLVHFVNDEPLSYDWLVIALGCVDKYHNIPGAEEYTNSIQTMAASRRTYLNANNTAPYGQVTIVGGGLSGVEMAAELRESRPDLNIRMLDRGPSILSPFPEKLQRYVRDWMLEHEIELRSHISLTRVEEGVLYNGEEGETIKTDITIWTAGIQPSPIVQNMDLPKDKYGRLTINEYHQLPDYTDVYIIGDCASIPFAPSGQAAGAQGEQVAEVLRALWKNETPRLGTIKLKGVLGSLGKKAGFGMMGKRTVMLGMMPRAIKSGVLWMSKNHFG